MRSWYRKDLKPFAQALRKNMTPQEKKLWNFYLKNLPVIVKRQRIIEGYIADFYIPSSKLVIEIDGSQHFEEDAYEYDRIRDEKMQSLGLTVLRFTNRDIDENIRGVYFEINRHLNLPVAEK